MPENNQSKIDLTQDILSKIDLVKPKSQWCFWLRNAGFIALIALLILIGSVSLGSFWIDLIELRNVASVGGLNLASIWSEALFELIGLAVVGIAIAYLVYRQTDWFMVRNRILLVLTFSACILLGGILYINIYSFAGKSNLQNRDIVQGSRIRSGRRQRLDNTLKNKGLFDGIVENNDSGRLEIRNQKGTFSFITNLETPNILNVEKGDHVIIRVNDKNQVISVRLIQ